MSLEPAATLLALAVVMTAVAAYCDLRTGLIPNRVLAVAAAGLLIARALQGALVGGVEGALISLGAGVIGGLLAAMVPLLLYRFGGIGGGDVKLLAALGFALGPFAALEAELYSFALLLLYAPARLLYEGTLMRTLSASGALLLRPFMPEARKRPLSGAALTSFRFGPAVFIATLIYCALRWGHA